MSKGALLNLPDFQQISHQELSSDRAGFEKLAKLLHELAGIFLPMNEKNLSLMAGRLASTLRDLDLSSYGEYHSLLVSSPDKKLISEFISALTTNTTEFFRENKHYEVLRTLIPDLIRRKQAEGNREVRIWCAASSTGQEPYSLMMTLQEMLPAMPAWDVRFLATDIDLEVLQKAADGFYTESELRNIPPQLRQKYFVSGGERRGEPTFRAARSLREGVRFAPFNLLTEPYPFQHPFDYVFCRNVLIYFEKATALRVIEKMSKSLAPGGYLFLGHAETGLTNADLLETVSHAVYRRKGGKRG